MIKPIVRDIFFLRQKSDAAVMADLPVAQDLEDTLRANRDRCVGMAANMIGYRKRMIIVSVGFADIVMINPVITAKSGPYETEEGCLSLEGVRATTRYNRIVVQYDDLSFRSCERTFTGRVAQAVQHEIDHCNGIVI